MVWVNGENYEGEWENGIMHGHGTLTTKEGRYEGKWNRNKKEGLGVTPANSAAWDPM